MTIHLRTLQLLARLARTHHRAMPRSRLAESLEISERQLRRDIMAYEQLREDAPPGQPLALPRLVTELRDGRAWVLLDAPTDGGAELGALALGMLRSDRDPVDVRLAFSPAAAVQASRRLWPGQLGWEVLPEGQRRVLRLRVPICGELVAWILTWRSACEALEPPELRDRLADELRDLLERYELPVDDLRSLTAMHAAEQEDDDD